MLTEKVKFTDLNGIEKIQTLYFKLSEEEIFSWELEEEKGLQARLEEARDAKDLRTLAEFVKTLLSKSVGIKSDDGVRFIKSPQITQNFFDSVFFSDFFFGLFLDDGKRAQKFINTIMPPDLVRRAAAQSQGQDVSKMPEPTPKERWDARQREKEQEPEVIDFTQFQHQDVQEAYSSTIEEVPQGLGAPVAYQKLEEEVDQSELEAFRRWQAQNVSTAPAEQPAEGWSRPPHESGPGQQFNQE